MLERLLTQAMCHGWKVRVCEIQAAVAEALNSQGRRRKAESLLLDSVELARRTGLAGIERHLRDNDPLLKSWIPRAVSGPDEDCPNVALAQLSRRELVGDHKTHLSVGQHRDLRSPRNSSVAP
jgi:hypothetical protein